MLLGLDSDELAKLIKDEYWKQKDAMKIELKVFGQCS